jgi:hypothetical protein
LTAVESKNWKQWNTPRATRKPIQIYKLHVWKVNLFKAQQEYQTELLCNCKQENSNGQQHINTTCCNINNLAAGLAPCWFVLIVLKPVSEVKLTETELGHTASFAAKSDT